MSAFCLRRPGSGLRSMGAAFTLLCLVVVCGGCRHKTYLQKSDWMEIDKALGQAKTVGQSLAVDFYKQYPDPPDSADLAFAYANVKQSYMQLSGTHNAAIDAIVKDCLDMKRDDFKNWEEGVFKKSVASDLDNKVAKLAEAISSYEKLRLADHPESGPGVVTLGLPDIGEGADMLSSLSNIVGGNQKPYAVAIQLVTGIISSAQKHRQELHEQEKKEITAALNSTKLVDWGAWTNPP
jgi:hypothetical protein